MEENKNKNQKPKHFLVLKIIGAVLVLIGISLIIASIVIKEPEMGDKDWFEISSIISGLRFGGIALCMFSVPLFISGFRPEITKMNTKSVKYIQQENKEDLTDIASTSADISSGAITKTTRAIKKGIKDTKFCKHCGAEIDADSKFCNSCGGEQ